MALPPRRLLFGLLLALTACQPLTVTTQSRPITTTMGTQAVTGGMQVAYPYTAGIFTTTQSGVLRWYSDTSNGLYTAGDGNTVTFTVTGSVIHLYGSKQARGCDVIPVTVDGVPYTFSCYNGGTTTPLFDQDLLTVGGLSNSPHTVTITNPVRGKYTYLYRVSVDVPGTPIVRRHLFRAMPDSVTPIDLPDLDFVADHYEAYYCSRSLPGTWASTIVPTAAYLKSRNPAINLYATDSLHTSTPGDFHFANADTGVYGVPTTLTSAVTAASTTIDVANGSAFPFVNFYVDIEGERILCSSRTGNTLNVQLAPYNGRGIRTTASPTSPATVHPAGAVASFPHEDWFLHDNTTGARLVNPTGTDAGFIMDIRNGSWVGQITDTAVATVGSNPQFAGLLLTKVGQITGSSALQRVNGGAGTLPTGYATAFTGATTSALNSIFSAIGKPVGISFSPNNGPVGAPNFTSNLIMQDGVGHIATSADTTLTPTASWNSQQSQWATQQSSSVVLAQGGTPSTGTAAANRNMLYALGSYLLMFNGVGTFDFWSGGYGDYHPYYDATDVRLGAALGAAYTDGTLRRRDFQNGVVFVNASTTTAVPYNFGNTLYVLDNGAIGAASPNIPRVEAVYTPQTSVNVQPASAVIAVFTP